MLPENGAEKKPNDVRQCNLNGIGLIPILRTSFHSPSGEDTYLTLYITLHISYNAAILCILRLISARMCSGFRHSHLSPKLNRIS